MSNLTEIIRQIQRDLSCPVCSKNYQINEIRLRGLLGQNLIVQTICRSGHITIFLATIKKEAKKASISTNDIIDLYRFLESFNGDFQKLWKPSL